MSESSVDNLVPICTAPTIYQWGLCHNQGSHRGENANEQSGLTRATKKTYQGASEENWGTVMPGVTGGLRSDRYLTAYGGVRESVSPELASRGK